MMQSSFQFQNPVITQIEFSENNNFIPKDNVDRISVPIELKIDHSEICNNTSEVSLTVIVGNKSDDIPYYLCATMSSKFRWKANVYDDDTIKSFLSKNAPALLLSYIRPIIASITNVSKFPINNLPFYDFTQSTESEAKD